MPSPAPIKRRLALVKAPGERSQADDIEEFLKHKAVVILAEPGMGKTVLLRSLDASGRRYFRARRFLAQEVNPNATSILIDGLDEARAGDRHGSTLERILGKLEAFGLPHFVMTCRSGDWFGETDRSRIVENVGYDDLVIVQLLPLLREDAVAVASTFTSNPAELIAEAERRGLQELLLNPELVRLLADAVKSGWPATKSDLFRQAIAVQAAESNDVHAQAAEDITVSEVSDAAGAICATYLISDCLGVARTEMPDEDVLDARTVPAASKAASAALGRRLFATLDQNVFAPNHRTTAEYLAGRWIAERVGNGIPSRRALSLITGHDGGTLASLRGLFSWVCSLADEQTAAALVATDPVAVVMQGDPTLFSDTVVGALIDALGERARHKDPWILAEYRSDEPWGALSRPSMWARFRTELSDPTTPPHFKAAILNALTYGKETPSGFTDVLAALALSNAEPYLVRTDAVDALARCGDVDNAIGAQLFSQVNAAGNDHDLQVRLAILQSRFSAAIDVSELANLVLAAVRRDSADVGIMAGGQIGRLTPIDRLEEFLDALAATNPPEHHGADELSHAAFAALRRLLAVRPQAITPARLHRWLPALGHSLFDEEREVVSAVRKHIVSTEGFQLAYLRLFVDDTPTNRLWNRLSDAVYDAPLGLDLTVQLVRDIASLAEDDPQRGPEVLWFVARLARSVMPLPEADFAALLALTGRAGDYNKARNFLTQSSLGHLEKQRAHESDRKRRELRQKADRIAYIRKNLAGIGAGTAPHPLFLLSGLLFARSNENKEPKPLRRRLQEALGDELATEAEAALLRYLFEGALPTPEETAEHAANNQTLYLTTAVAAAVELYWRSPEINQSADKLVAAFPRERLASIFIGHMHGGSITDDLEKDDDRESLDESVATAAPDAVADALTRYMTPLLEAGANHIQGSYALANYAGYSRVAALIAPRLLRAKLNAPLQILTDLVLAAIHGGAGSDLMPLVELALDIPDLEPAQRTSWITVGYLLNPDAYTTRLETQLRDPEHGVNNARSSISLIFPDRRRKAPSSSLDLASLERAALLFGHIFPNPRNSTLSRRGRTGTEVDDFVKGCVSRIAADYGDDAAAALSRLINDPDLSTYRDDILHAAEGRSKIVRERGFKHSSPVAVAAALRNGPPANIDDLAALTIGHLEELSAHYQSGDTDGWRKFWNTDSHSRATMGGHKGEEECRDRLLDDLRARLKSFGVRLLPELHVADDKEVDIAALSDAMKLPIEIKLETHAKLWSAPSAQLERLYSIDPEAQGRGLYVVLWLGGQTMGRSVPTAPNGLPRPTSAAELLDALRGLYANSGLLQFVVLDATPKKMAPVS
jgi:hypothetical protein